MTWPIPRSCRPRTRSRSVISPALGIRGPEGVDAIVGRRDLGELLHVRRFRLRLYRLHRVGLALWCRVGPKPLVTRLAALLADARFAERLKCPGLWCLGWLGCDLRARPLLSPGLPFLFAVQAGPFVPQHLAGSAPIPINKLLFLISSCRSSSAIIWAAMRAFSAPSISGLGHSSADTYPSPSALRLAVAEIELFGRSAGGCGRIIGPSQWLAEVIAHRMGGCQPFVDELRASDWGNTPTWPG